MLTFRDLHNHSAYQGEILGVDTEIAVSGRTLGQESLNAPGSRTLHPAMDRNGVGHSVANWQCGQVLLNSIAAELITPTQSAAAIAAATASPMISYKIGQYFKSKNTESPSAHILAHAVLSAAVAAAGDNNALTVAISAGGAEAAVPVISNWLYGEIDRSALTAEQKETVSAITNLLGATTGAAIGNSNKNATQGSLNAQ